MSELNQKDMYPTDGIYSLIFDFTETDSYNSKFEDLGYSGTNFIELSGSALINVCLSILIFALQYMTKCLCKWLFKYSFIRDISVKLSKN